MHLTLNADQVIATGGSCCLSTFDVGTNFVTDTSDPSTVQYMRTACKNIMYTVVNSNAYAGETSLTLALWMKIMGWCGRGSSCYPDSSGVVL